MADWLGWQQHIVATLLRKTTDRWEVDAVVATIVAVFGQGVRRTLAIGAGTPVEDGQHAPGHTHAVSALALLRLKGHRVARLRAGVPVWFNLPQFALSPE